MEFAIALLVLLVVGTYFIVRPGSTMIDVVEPPVPSEPAEELPSASSLKRMKKADLESLAADRGVDVSGTKSEIIERLLP